MSCPLELLAAVCVFHDAPTPAQPQFRQDEDELRRIIDLVQHIFSYWTQALHVFRMEHAFAKIASAHFIRSEARVLKCLAIRKNYLGTPLQSPIL